MKLCLRIVIIGVLALLEGTASFIYYLPKQKIKRLHKSSIKNMAAFSNDDIAQERKRRRRSNKTQQTRHRRGSSRTIITEPAGVEGFFFSFTSKAPFDRHRRHRYRSFQKVSSLLRRRRKTHTKATTSTIEDSLDVWGLEEARRNLSSDITSWACTDVQEQSKLAAMKLLLKDDFDKLSTIQINLPTSDNDMITTDPISAYPDVYSDLRLLRFLRKDENQDPISAAQRFKDFIQWRVSSEIDAKIRYNIALYGPFGKAPTHVQNVLGILEKCTPCSFEDSLRKITLDESMNGGKYLNMALLNVGSWDTATITSLIQNGEKQKKQIGDTNAGANIDNDTTVLTLSTFLDYWTYIYESIHYNLYQSSIQNQKLTYLDEICDLSDLSLRQLFANPPFVSQVLKPWMYHTQYYYPETTNRIIFYNPPKVINVVWNVVSQFVSEGTLNKVSFVREKSNRKSVRNDEGRSIEDFVRDEMKKQLTD